MDFARDTGRGLGLHWRGILFRREYKELGDLLNKSREWFPRIWPGARFVGGEQYKWIWPGGEELLFRTIKDPADYWSYHGHEYPWMAWEELTNWPSAEDACYDTMHSCWRTSTPGIPKRRRATCNPYGVGHNFVKARFIDPAPFGVPFTDEAGRQVVAISGNIYENKYLAENDPQYIIDLENDPNPNRRKAWLEGSWDIVAGGMFDDLWRAAVHVLEPFEIPRNWIVTRSFDWGSSKPFSVGWWAVSNGEALPDGRAWPRGTRFLIAEWYGWNGKPNEGLRMLAVDVARGVLQREREMGLTGRVLPGVADSAIFAVENGQSIADDMARGGVKWEPSEKGAGSRRAGWEKLRSLMAASLKRPMEAPGLFVFSTCRQFLRTVPTLPRDEKDPDDVDSDAEDHIADAVRYHCMHKLPMRLRLADIGVG